MASPSSSSSCSASDELLTERGCGWLFFFFRALFLPPPARPVFGWPSCCFTRSAVVVWVRCPTHAPSVGSLGSQRCLPKKTCEARERSSFSYAPQHSRGSRRAPRNKRRVSNNTGAERVKRHDAHISRHSFDTEGGGAYSSRVTPSPKKKGEIDERKEEKKTKS